MVYRGVTITDVLNSWNEIGVFSYVIPFLLIFAVVYAILQKSKILDNNKTLDAIVAAAVGLLSIQFDFVSSFYAVIFPRFGIGLAIFLVVMILIGFFYSPASESKMQWIGWATGIGVVIWAWTSWDDWFGTSGMYGFGDWFGDYLWALIVLGIIIGLIVFISKSSNSGGTTSTTTASRGGG